MNINPTTLDAIYYTFDTRFQAAYQAADSFYQDICTTVPSSSREMRYAWIGKLPRMREWLGNRVVNNLAAREYTLLNRDFEDTFKVARNDIEDDQIGLYNYGIDMLAMQAKTWPDDLATTLLSSGDSTTSAAAVCYDGQPFFSANHPTDPNNPASAVQSNLFNTTTSAGSTPLTANNYATVRAKMMGYQGEDGKPFKIIPDLLVVPPLLEVTANQILNSQILATTVGTNAATGGASNVIPGLKGNAKVLCVPYLAGTIGGVSQDATWYLLATGFPIRPFVFQLRKAPQFTPLDNVATGNVFWRREYIYGVDSRGNAGYALWFLAAKAAA